MRNPDLYSKYPFIVISGVTASGKSSLAIELAKKFNGVIFNGDSKQVFKEIPVSTAQPKLISDGERMLDQGIEHYLYGYISIYENFNVAEYLSDLKSSLTLVREGTPIFLTGGSGLYIDSFIYGYEFNELKNLFTDKNGNTYDTEHLRKLTVDELLELIPSETLEKLNNSDRGNSRRLIQALLRGFENKQTAPIKHLYLYLDIDKEILRERVLERTSKMFRNGILQEAEMLKNLIIDQDPRVNIIGLKEFKGYFEGEARIEDVEELINIHTMQYAKRQRTWFRNVGHRYRAEELDKFETQISNFLNSFATP